MVGGSRTGEFLFAIIIGALVAWAFDAQFGGIVTFAWLLGSYVGAMAHRRRNY